MQQKVLLPAGMKSSTFEQSLPPTLAERAATGTHSDGSAVPGKWHIYPELAPDGLWTTPSDLARFGIELSLSREGNADHILSQAMTRQMLTPQCHDVPGDVAAGRRYSPWLPILQPSRSEQLLQLEINHLKAKACRVHWDPEQPDHAFLTCEGAIQLP